MFSCPFLFDSSLSMFFSATRSLRGNNTAPWQGGRSLKLRSSLVCPRLQRGRHLLWLFRGEGSRGAVCASGYGDTNVCVAGQAGRGQPGLAAEQPPGLWGVSATDNIPLKAVFVKFVLLS